MRGLKYISWGNNSGYAIAAKSYVRALIDVGIDVTWTPIVPGNKLNEPERINTWPCSKLTTVYNRAIDYDTVLIHAIPECYPEWIDRERLQGRRIFGYTVWEFDYLQNHWPEILNRLDGVIVPCTWNVDVFRNSGVTVPIHVVPHLSQFEDVSVPTNASRMALQSRLGNETQYKDCFVFYTIGEWSNRKAHYLTLEAYWQAFDADDPVVMIVKTSANDITTWHRHWRNLFRNRHQNPEKSIAKLLKKYPHPAPVLILTDDSLSDEEMFALHEMGDCYISLARTEGWGLGAFEAARLGKPVVMTGYGGQLDYLSPDLSWMVDYEMVSVYEPGRPANLKPGVLWAAPSVSHAATQLREVYDNQLAATAQAQQLAGRIAVDFSREATVNSLLAALS